MEGGCYNDKATDNEVLVKNICQKPVASIIFGEKVDEHCGSSVTVNVIDPLVDKPLLVLFALYALRTSR